MKNTDLLVESLKEMYMEVTKDLKPKDRLDIAEQLEEFYRWERLGLKDA